jgi:hypothetical protein
MCRTALQRSACSTALQHADPSCAVLRSVATCDAPSIGSSLCRSAYSCSALAASRCTAPDIWPFGGLRLAAANVSDVRLSAHASHGAVQTPWERKTYYCRSRRRRVSGIRTALILLGRKLGQQHASAAGVAVLNGQRVRDLLLRRIRVPLLQVVYTRAMKELGHCPHHHAWHSKAPHGRAEARQNARSYLAHAGNRVEWTRRTRVAKGYTTKQQRV